MTDTLTWTDIEYTDLRRSQAALQDRLDQINTELAEADQILGPLQEARDTLLANLWPELSTELQEIRHLPDGPPVVDAVVALSIRAYFPEHNTYSLSNLRRSRDYITSDLADVNRRLRAYQRNHRCQDGRYTVHLRDFKQQLPNIPGAKPADITFNTDDTSIHIPVRGLFIDCDEQPPWALTPIRIPLPPINIALHPRSNTFSITALENNALRPFYFGGTNTVHPHSMNTTEICAGTYQAPIGVAIAEQDWGTALTLILLSLTTVTSTDSAGMQWPRGLFRILGTYSNGTWAYDSALLQERYIRLTDPVTENSLLCKLHQSPTNPYLFELHDYSSDTTTLLDIIEVPPGLPLPGDIDPPPFNEPEDDDEEPDDDNEYDDDEYDND